MEQERLVTADELEQMPGAKDFELVRGKLVPGIPADDRHGQAAVVLAAELRAHVRKNHLGRVSDETGYILFRNPDTVRGPDVSFVASGRAFAETRGLAQGAPDLAIEIISPKNGRETIAAKVHDYLAAGTRLVWVVDTTAKTVAVHRHAGEARVLDVHDHLDGEEVVPGFSYWLADFFDELD